MNWFVAAVCPVSYRPSICEESDVSVREFDAIDEVLDLDEEDKENWVI